MFATKTQNGKLFYLEFDEMQQKFMMLFTHLNLCVLSRKFADTVLVEGIKCST